MKFIDHHIQTCLRNFLTDYNSTFCEVFDCIHNGYKIEYKPFLKYIDNILNKTYSKNCQELKILHINFEQDFKDPIKLLIAEYLLIRNFKQYQLNDNSSIEKNTLLSRLIVTLETSQKKLETQCPEGASGKNGGNKISKQWTLDKQNNKSLLLFYKGLKEYSSLESKLLFNTQNKLNNLIIPFFQYNPYAIQIEDNKISYNIINTNYTLNEIEELNDTIIDKLDTIILFECERKRKMINFSIEEIIKWNSEYDTNFKHYLMFTFGKEPQSVNNICNKIDTIRERFKIPIETTYTILSSEMDFLLKRNEKTNILIDFVGFETSSFWDTFLLETNIRELYELRSVKLMNIYSLCLSEELKNYIIEELFSKNEFSELISLSTKQALLELRDDDVNIIKEALANTLNIIINSEIKSKINERLNNVPTIILDDAIIRNLKLMSKFSKTIALTKSVIFKTWSDLPSLTSNYILILSYRDQGKYPNYFNPNLIEFEYQEGKIATAILPNFLFGHHYNWSKYYLLKDYHKYLSHPIRQNHFEWNNLINTIQSLRPESKLNIDWNLEYELSNSEPRETYKVKIKNQRAKIFNSSDFLILSEASSKKPRIERVKWLYENLDLNENDYEIQKLDDLLDEFNPAEKLIDTTQQEIELEIIRKQLGLEKETAGRLWKVLLKRKSDMIGIAKFYEELKMIFKTNNISIVSINHFQNSWINIESDSLMPRGNKVFKILCDYLGLNNNYRLILYSLKNASINGKIEATKKYSRLLKDLFSDCCFDENVSAEIKLQSNIEYYRNNHVLDELGIDNENPLKGLLTLIELVKPEIKLSEIETIEKIEQ